MLEVRLARLALPLPLELSIRRALVFPERAAQHEGLVLSWELSARILAGSLWAACREIGATSTALETATRNLERPSFGHWVELARACSTLLRGRTEPAAAAFAATLAGLEEQLPANGGLRSLAARIAALPAKNAPKPRRIQELLDALPFYRNAAQSTHGEVLPGFREESVPALLEALIDFCERVPLTGTLRLIYVRRLERATSGHVAEIARLSGSSVSWSLRAFDESLWKRLSPARTYLYQEPDLVVPLFPMAAVASSGADWHVGWYARQVHAPTVAYQGIAGNEFQLVLAPDELRALTAGGPAVPDDVSAAALALEPFRGLLSYDEEHAVIFHGREENTEAALARIDARGTLLVFGASGSGKSSWVKAGIVPALRVRAALAGRRIRLIVVVPGDRPLAALRRALTAARAGSPEEAASWARAVDDALPEATDKIHAKALAHLLRGLAMQGETPVLIVDQLEEVATASADRAQAHAFLELLATAAASASEMGAVVLASVRADLMAPLIENEPVRAWLASDGEPIGSIPPERLTRVIVDPLHGRKVAIEPGLAETIVADVASEPGTLALLSQVLTTLWQERERFGGALTKQGYVDAGRVSGALEKQAEAALAEIVAAARPADGASTPAHADANTEAGGSARRVDRLFRALAQSEENKRFARRRVEVRALASELATSEAEVRALSEPFVKRRLVVFGGGSGGERTLEVAHERLLEAWPRLKNLLASEREVLELRREVEHASEAWRASGGRSELWTDGTSKLRRAAELLASERLDLDERGRAFLAASRAGVRRRKRIERTVLAVVAVLGVAAGVSAIRASRQEALAKATLRDLLSLSAIQDLKELEARADALWPADPDNVAEYESWLSAARLLIEGQPENAARGVKKRLSLAEHEEKLAEIAQRAKPPTAEALEADRRATRDWRRLDFEDGEDRWWHAQLSKLVSDLKSFTDEERGGLFSSGTSAEHGWGIVKRAEFARTIAERSVSGADAQRRWDEAITAIAVNPKYGGLRVTSKVGLIPIGADPESGLWEFAHLQTGEAAVRGKDGKLVVTEATGLVFVLIPGAAFWMGAQKTDERGRNYDPQALGHESPVHEVTLTPYFLSKYEMTQGQWLRSTGRNPSQYGPSQEFPGYQHDLTHPVEQVTWTACMALMEQLGLELPSEAQWENGCRGGRYTPWWTGVERESLRGKVNLADRTAKNADATWGEVHDWPDLDDGWAVHAPVGSLAANPYGLHEVHGNVWEWCRDGRDGLGGYSTTVQSDPVTPWVGAQNRVDRGGSFRMTAASARSANRANRTPEYQGSNLGLRPARAFTP